MDMGTHDPRTPTMAELMAYEMVTMPDGSLARPVVAVRQEGWTDDRTISEGEQERLSALHARLDAFAEHIRECTRLGQPDRIIASAVGFATAWEKLRKGNGS
jgi:uncharacterized protein (UPF0548 family)